MAENYEATKAKIKPQENAGEIGKAQSRYQACEQYRQPFLERARECAELTIPALIPPQGWSATQKLYTPFQGIGARGVNNLASKLLLALFPPNSPFFRMRVEEETKTKLNQTDPKKGIADRIEQGLAKVERTVSNEIETQMLRPSLFEGLKHDIVGGNVLLYFPEKEKGMRVFHLDRYVVRRDPIGNELEIVVKESISPSSLNAKFFEQIKEKLGDKTGDDKTVDLYTYVYRDDKDADWKVCQEVKGLTVPGSEGTYPKDKCPWLPLRWTIIDGEDYGRGYVEEYLGDLKSLEGLSQAIVEGSAAAAKVLFLVNPNGTTKLKDLQDAPNGSFRSGNAADIAALQVDKFNDFRVARESADGIEKRLAFAFMLNQSVQRPGERVTAEEIRFMIQEIEDGLGGIYSVLSHTLQLRMVNILMDRMVKEKKLPALPKDKVAPAIVTGLEALGRGHDLTKLRAFVGEAIQILGPEVAQRYMNVDNFLARLATAAGIDTEGLIKTQEEVAAADQAAQKQAQQQKMMPEMMKSGTELAKGAMSATNPAAQAAIQSAMQKAAATGALPGAPGVSGATPPQGGGNNRVYPAAAAAARSAVGATPRPGTPSAG